jgi:hypothetical protein
VNPFITEPGRLCVCDNAAWGGGAAGNCVQETGTRALALQLAV